MKRSARRVAWFLAIVGAIAAGSGYAAGFVPLVAIGLVLFGAGAWNLSRPSVTGLLVDGIALILAGAFHCLVWLVIDDARASSFGKWVFTGLVQIVWGVRRLATYTTARRTVNDPRAIARLESVVGDLVKRKASADSTVVEFRTGRFHLQRNRIGLYDEGAVALFEGQYVRLEKRSDIWIEAFGTTSLGRSIKVRIQMGDFHLMGQMSAAHFERFEHWKLGMSSSLSIAA